jgi:hypothetical protein
VTNGPNSIANRAADEVLAVGEASGTLGVTVGTVEAVGDGRAGSVGRDDDVAGPVGVLLDVVEPGAFAGGVGADRGGVGGGVVGGVGRAGADGPMPRRWRR